MTGGRLIREDVEKHILEMAKRDHPVWDKWRPKPKPITRRQRLRWRVMDIRYAIADRIGGGRLYTDGCDDW